MERIIKYRKNIKKIIFVHFFVIALLPSINAQNKNASKYNRLTFTEWAAYYGNGNYNTDDVGSGSQQKQIGNTFGLIASWNEPYSSTSDNAKFTLGWTAKFSAGWNFSTRKAAKYNAEIGFWGSQLIAPNIEVGLQYSFLGIYSYQNISFFGSSLETALRVYNFQASYSRDGEGAFSGCISSKSSGINTNTLGLKYLTKKNYFAGIRLTNYLSVKEYSLVLGLTSL